MRVLQIAGIFGSPAEFRANALQESMETLLAEGLKDAGIHVETQSHALWNSFAGIDLVHVHHLANSCVQLPLRRGLPVVFTRHATKVVALHHRMVLSSTYKRADAVVVLSQRERSMVLRERPWLNPVVIPNAVRVEHFPYELRRGADGKSPWRFLYVGQLIELKRVHLALHLVARLRARGFHSTLRVVSHRPTLQRDLEELARHLDVSDVVTFVGPRGRAGIAEEMRRAHVLVLPSRTEALPTVVSEAVLTGLPVVAFDVGGVAEQLPMEQELPAVNMVDHWYSSAIRMLENYDTVLESYRRQALVARHSYSIEHMVRKHIELYGRLLHA